MAKRTSVYISATAERIIGEAPDSLSGRLNTIVARYGGILAEDCPGLAMAEWSALCDVLNGTWLLAESGGGMDPARYIWADLLDAEGVGEKLAIDARNLAERIRAMRYAEQVAICEIVTRFWRHPRLNELSTPDLLRDCGAHIQEE